MLSARRLLASASPIVERMVAQDERLHLALVVLHGFAQAQESESDRIQPCFTGR